MQPFDIIEKYNFWTAKPVNLGLIRDHYLQQIVPQLNNRLVKIILGQRRCGKSFLLRMLIDALIEQAQVPRENILYINKELHGFEFIATHQDLLDCIEQYKNKLKPTGKIYLFLDEVQEISGWEVAINSLSQDYIDHYEIIVTGSNAKLLASELGTYLSGRYVQFDLYPFSYSEYLQYKQQQRGKQSFIDYLMLGGIPELYHLDSQEMKNSYLQSVKDSIVLRDIIQRHQIRDAHLLNKLIALINDSVGSLFSINSVVNTLKSKGYKSNHETIGNYLSYLQEAFYIHACHCYDIKGKQQLSPAVKYYLNDNAFKTYFSSSFDKGPSKLLENAIFLALKRSGYQVYVGKLFNREIDFIAEKNDEKLYIQVAYLLSSESVIARELGNLKKIDDNYPKYVISLDDWPMGNFEGIKHQQAWLFC